MQKGDAGPLTGGTAVRASKGSIIFDRLMGTVNGRFSSTAE